MHLILYFTNYISFLREVRPHEMGLCKIWYFATAEDHGSLLTIGSYVSEWPIGNLSVYILCFTKKIIMFHKGFPSSNQICKNLCFQLFQDYHLLQRPELEKSSGKTRLSLEIDSDLSSEQKVRHLSILHNDKFHKIRELHHFTSQVEAWVKFELQVKLELT